MKAPRRVILLASLMCATSIAAVVARPTEKVAVPPLFEMNVPKNFGDWTLLPERAQVVDPVVQSIYAEVLARTYENKDGYRIMLSLAYGSDQRANLQAHRPEVCYVAQGFDLLVKPKDGSLATPYGDVRVRRLTARLGTRIEPITYWLTNGNRIVVTDWERRIEQIRFALTGEIPDGLVFRVSSIDADSSQAFAVQRNFVADLLASVPPTYRQRLSGLEVPAPASSGT